jgi:queuosine biosynthesis protein QueC
MKKAIILVSGGLDSATVLAMAQAEGYSCYALSFAYGQRHKTELNAATRVAKAARVAEHRVIAMDLGSFRGSALTDTTTAIPKARTAEEIAEGIPVTYVPARNTIFLSFALAWAEVLRAYDIFIGVNALDYSGYPDCRPEFIRSFDLRGGGEAADQHPRTAHPHEQGRHYPRWAEAGCGLRHHRQLLRSRSGRQGLRHVRFLPASAERLP